MLKATSSDAAVVGAVRSKGLGYLVVAIIATIFVMFLASADQAIFAIVLPLIKKDLRLSDGELGLLSGVPFAVCYGLFSVPAAWLGDTRLRRTTVISASIAIWSLTTALCGAAGGLWSLFLLRMGVGTGEAGGRPSSFSLVADLSPEHWRRRVIAICGVGATVGTALAYLLTSWVAGHFGWREAFVMMGAPGIVVALVYPFSVREPKRVATTHADAGAVLVELRALAASPAFLTLFVGSGFVTWLVAGIAAWMPTYLVRTLHISLTEMGAVLAASGAIVGLLSPIAFSWLGDRMGKRDAGGPLRLCALSLLASIVVFTGILVFARDKVAIYVSVVIFQFLISGPAPLLSVAAMDAFPKLKGTGLAAMAVGGSLVGAFAPWVVGVISDRLAGLGEAGSLRGGLLAIIPLALVGVASFWAASRIFAQAAQPRTVEG